MKKSFLKKAEIIAQMNGLRVDQTSGVIFGVKNGYEVCLSAVDQTRQYILSVSVVGQSKEPLSPKEFDVLVKSTKALAVCNVVSHKANFSINPGMSQKKTTENIQAGLDAVIRYLQENRYENCCQDCSATGVTDAYIVSGAPAQLCSSCFAAHGNAADMKQQAENLKKENMITGIVGALIGSLIGVGAIVILGQLGYVASISGFIMAICVLKGYELLAGKLSVKGIVITSVIMIAMVYVGNQVDWALFVMPYLETDFFTSFRAVPMLLEEEYLEAASYFGNLAMVYLFTVVGAVPTIYNEFKHKKLGNVTYKMSAEENF